MQNSPTISVPPPLPLPPPPPPLSGGQINVIPAPPPPPQFSGAPSAVFQITVLPAPPPPPFFDDSSSIDFSPLEFLFAVIAIVTIPALIYTFIFAFRCSSSRRRDSATGEFAGDPSVASEISHRDDIEVAAGAGEAADEKYRKESDVGDGGVECPVCLSAFASGDEIRQLSACKHSFHASCIDIWLTNHSNCPVCRTTIAGATNKRSNSVQSQSRDGDQRQGQRDADALV